MVVESHLKRGSPYLLKCMIIYPAHLLVFSSHSIKVAGHIESLYKRFLWSSHRGKNLSHLLDWERVKHLMEEGGLHTFNIKHHNQSLLVKRS